MASLGGLGILSKLAERRGCSPLATTTVVFGAATAMTAFYVGAIKRSGFVPPGRVVAIALIFGVFTVLASWAFLYGIRFGKITTSWVVISLSAAVPTIASTLIYHEPMSLRKIGALLLAAVAILRLWKDMQTDTEEAPGGVKVESES
jgi:drug/metabolite transporter (DMT)-like permease